MSSLLGIDLVAAHMVGDYILQTDWMAREKLTNPIARLTHCFAYMAPVTVVAAIHNPAMAGLFFVVNLIAHFIVDSRRWSSGDKWPPKPILVDQTIHLTILAVTARLLTWGLP